MGPEITYQVHSKIKDYRIKGECKFKIKNTESTKEKGILKCVRQRI